MSFDKQIDKKMPSLIISCRDRTGEFQSAIRSFQSPVVIYFSTVITLRVIYLIMTIPLKITVKSNSTNVEEG